EVIYETVVGLACNGPHDCPLALECAIANEPMARLAEDQVPRPRRRQWPGLDDAPGLKFELTDARRNPMHGAQPCELAHELTTDARRDRFPLARDVSVAERIARVIRLEITSGQAPEHLGHMLLQAAIAALAREETAKGRNVVRD